MTVEIDFSDFMWLPDLFHRRQNLVQNLVEEGHAFADAYAAAGGRKRDPKTRRYHARGTRRMVRIRKPSANQYARGIEHVAYHKFIDWWDRSW
jgi:hypothetical protein